MDYVWLYNTLNKLSKLEEELNKGEIKLDDPKLLEYHQLVSSIPILSPEDLLEYHEIILDLMDEEYEEKIKKRMNNFKDRIRRISNQKQVQVNQGDELEDIYLRAQEETKANLLNNLRQKCSPKAYSQIEAIVEQSMK